jgi:hypothetical protein
MNVINYFNQISLLLLDIVTGPKILRNEFLLDTSSEQPGGKIEKFEKILHHNKPSPKHSWYLILKIEDSIKELRNDLLNEWFSPFKQSFLSYLPHITIGKITHIDNEELFLKTIEQANKKLLEEKKLTIFFDKNHMVLKHPKVFRGAKFKNSLLMLTIHRNEPAEQLAFTLVNSLPEIEQKVLANSSLNETTIFQKIQIFFQKLLTNLQTYLPKIS